MTSGLIAHLRHDFPASVVVFLVALPLCLGIAIASGVPPASGIVTGIIGGIVVGFFAGSPLQVSGPAAGLTVMVFTIIQDYGAQGLAHAVCLAGLLQLIAGHLKLGQWFKAISPAVIYGMLAGIGVIIMVSQCHLMVDDRPYGSSLKNLLTIPLALYKGVYAPGAPMLSTVHQQAACIGLITVMSIILWERYRPKSLRALPGALIAVLIATVCTMEYRLPIQRIAIPQDLWQSLPWLDVAHWHWLKSPVFVHDVLGLAIIASAETLLCATAVDKMQSDGHTDYNRELMAQGLGNFLCGIVGALPMTGVIVRSSANIDAGAKTRLSAILHGLWILILVMSFPSVLRQIPQAALAAILVFTGYKLLNFMALKKMASYGHSEIMIYLVTVFGIVVVDLLTGVLTGLVLSLLKIIVTVSQITLAYQEQPNQVCLSIKGAATVLTLPKITDGFHRAFAVNKSVRLDIDQLLYIDHACIDFLEAAEARLKAKGLSLFLDQQQLQHKLHRVHL